jgi:ATP-dependent Clp protease ATP-binding subunit ClpA
MFERFTDRARRVVVLAQEEARMLDHNYIGTEHILLGLVHEEDGLAARALTELNVSLDTVRDRVEYIIGRGKQTPSGHIPFTPRAKKVLELSLKESIQLGHNHIGTEHILLGLMREGDGVACRVLEELGLSTNAVRQAVIRQISQRSPESLATSLGPATTIEFRLKRIESRLGIAPSETLRSLDEQITRVRADKEAAIDAQDFERAAALRFEEKLLLRERAAASETLEEDVTSVLDELAGTRAEIARLTALLREHGIDPEAPPAAAEGEAEG